jgi:hypothetical protein
MSPKKGYDILEKHMISTEQREDLIDWLVGVQKTIISLSKKALFISISLMDNYL